MPDEQPENCAEAPRDSHPEKDCSRHEVEAKRLPPMLDADKWKGATVHIQLPPAWSSGSIAEEDERWQETNDPHDPADGPRREDEDGPANQKGEDGEPEEFADTCSGRLRTSPINVPIVREAVQSAVTFEGHVRSPLSMAR